VPQTLAASFSQPSDVNSTHVNSTRGTVAPRYCSTPPSLAISTAPRRRPSPPAHPYSLREIHFRIRNPISRPDLFTQGFILHPSGSVACTPSRSLRPTAAPTSMAPCLMALLPVGDLRGPIYSASLRPLILSGRFRPPHPRVDVPALRHCASGQVFTGIHVRWCDLSKVGATPWQCRDLGHAIAVSSAPVIVIDRNEQLFSAHIQQLQSYKRPWLEAKLQGTNMLKVSIYLTWCMRRNLH
jgi:hypothetical protein